ncbi:TetR/AcrR family transcriptional regulator [Sporolactobacillus terrae]|uniref:TetR family transcriptional regulator n=1 Tax=Sporolactobacillus terrae TaxID=269673 RepID=A0A410D5S9_9BACL|nr:TetR/AcrR family transcriptional regulator [Sporolactobacillus terrae]QAA21449.1 TetR/AcrR family transcriptional regulator [Sporolactobacillus terrae]QAA24421.1 TetR/AcrR family transcriptional regulator [Sporolactobacillus terrae]UAK16248.1 TetR/AcrR family transcriptional regulator [Sporolactobacillus terrae]BBN97716.1 TetR family transcriptional regulator [Sporolactobacillus terrae]
MDKQLPNGIALSWGLGKPSSRGPKREMSLKQIVDTAVSIADKDGLAAVSMNRVAKSLGFTAMSLYRYIPSKDDLIILMQDAISDLSIPLEKAEHGWREAMEAFVQATIDVYKEHPWFLETPIYGVPMTPNALKVVDWALGGLQHVPLEDSEKMAVILLLSSYARACGILQKDMARAMQLGSPPDAFSGKGYADTLASLVTPERFPYLHSVVASGAYTDENQSSEDAGDDIEFGLKRILDGIEQYLKKKKEQT